MICISETSETLWNPNATPNLYYDYLTLSTGYIQNLQVDLPPLVLTRVSECGEEWGHHLVPVFMSEVSTDNSETSSRNAAVMISVITRQR